MLTTRSFDAVGRLLSVTDSSGARTEYAYNAVNQITTITDALGGETSFTYDANGNLLTLTDARGKTTTWTYDSMDRAATRLDPLTRSESFTYDENGAIQTWTDRKGQVTSYQYDATALSRREARAKRDVERQRVGVGPHEQEEMIGRRSSGSGQPAVRRATRAPSLPATTPAIARRVSSIRVPARSAAPTTCWID